jgi:NADPH:quinone reductase-like Zn-dependent oxidoreductase
MSAVSVMARRILAGIVLLGTIVASHNIANATSAPSTFNVQVQTACENEMLDKMGASEVFSGKAYDVLKKVARAYGRPVPHIYILPGEWNMAYIAASTAVDGRGKIVVGQQAAELFTKTALKGFLGHEMAHLVSDSAAEGCNDYVVRDPQTEADADALAARTLGTRPVKAFLERVQALTEPQNDDGKHRLELLQRLRSTKSSGTSTSLGTR